MNRGSAIFYGKMATDNRCVFTGMTGIDGAHIFSAGEYPQFADIPENIVGMRRDHHSVPQRPCFDWTQRYGVWVVRPISERRYMLEHMSLEEFRPAIRNKIRIMGLYCEKYGVEFPEAEQPTDYEALMLQGRQ